MSGGKSIFTVGFKADKSGLNEVLKQLQDIQNRANQISLGDNATKQMKQDMADVYLAAKDLEKVLNNSWNSKLGQLDLNKFNNGLAQSNQSIASLNMYMLTVESFMITPIAYKIFDNKNGEERRNEILKSM